MANTWEELARFPTKDPQGCQSANSTFLQRTLGILEYPLPQCASGSGTCAKYDSIVLRKNSTFQAGRRPFAVGLIAPAEAGPVALGLS